MNDRLVLQDGFPKPPNTPEAPRIRKWSRSVVVAVTVTCMSLTMSPPGSNFAEDQGSDAGRSDDTGKEVGSWLLTVPYGSLLCCQNRICCRRQRRWWSWIRFFRRELKNRRNHLDHKRLWDLHPPTSRLRGEEPIHFLGKANDKQSEPVKRASATSDHAKKRDVEKARPGFGNSEGATA